MHTAGNLAKGCAKGLALMSNAGRGAVAGAARPADSGDVFAADGELLGRVDANLDTTACPA